MLNKAFINELFRKGKKNNFREVLFFCYLYANATDGWSISVSEIETRFSIPKTTANRIMKRKWSESGMGVEWEWNKNELTFRQLDTKGGTVVEQEWNGIGIESKQKTTRKKRHKTPTVDPNYQAEKQEREQVVEDVITYLNQATDKNYQLTATATRTLIIRLLNNGYSFTQICTVIDNKTAEWKNTKQDKYLRPQTLFGGKFEGYLNEKKIIANQEEIKFHEKISKNDKYKDATDRARQIDYGVIANTRKEANTGDAGDSGERI